MASPPGCPVRIALYKFFAPNFICICFHNCEEVKARSSWVEQGGYLLLRQPLVYLHYFGLSIYGTEGDFFVKEASFPILTKQMMDEFRLYSTLSLTK